MEDLMTLVTMRKIEENETKLVQPNQKALEALPLNSGMWRVAGIPGLYVRCRAVSKSFVLQRRVDGVLLKEVLGPLTMKRAKEQAMDRWNSIKPAFGDDDVRLDPAVEAYIRHRLSMKKMGETTAKLARYNNKKYLNGWRNRTLEEIVRDRAGIAALHTKLTKGPGPATCNQVMRLLSAVYRWHRDRIERDLPDWPRKVAEIHSIPPRKWAYTDAELKAWWHAVEDGKAKTSDLNSDSTFSIDKGVSTLSPIRRMWWLTALFTGARKGSIEAVKWTDLDLEKKTVLFRVTKGNRPYVVPLSDKLAEFLRAYHNREDVPASEWVFPSSAKNGNHIVRVQNDREGVGPAHRLRHSFRTTLAQLGASEDQARLLMGHSMAGNVSRDYITAPLLVESLRPLANDVAKQYVEIIGLE
jgi:integrase